jgi:hypothetical protein
LSVAVLLVVELHAAGTHHSLNICRRSLAEEQERGVLDFNIPLWPQIESMPRIPRRQRPPSPIISSGAAINPATDRMHSHSNLAARRPRPGHYLLLGALTPPPLPPSERERPEPSLGFTLLRPALACTQKKSCLCVAPRPNTHALFAAAGAFKERRQTSKFKDQALVCPYHQARRCSSAQDEKLRPFCFCSSRNKLGA